MTKMVITYRLTLESPVVLGIPGGDPDSAETLSYISGSAVVGALAGQWLSMGEQGGMATFHQLFLDESVRYLNAYPEGENNSRMLPAPLSLCIRKGMPDIIYDLAEPYRDDLIAETDDQAMTYQYQPWHEGYIRFTGKAVKYRSAQQTSAIHHQRDRKLGRAKENQDPIFSYISLNSGERFIGKILIDDSTHAHLLVQLLQNNPLYLGRSRSAQYGRASVSMVLSESLTYFDEAGLDRISTVPRLVVTLLSDYIGTSVSGHPTQGAFIPELAGRLGTELTQEMVVDSFVGTRPVSGYVNKWQMPRPVLPALQAGSVFVIQIEEPPQTDRIHALLWEGLGQRRAEGFGRLALSWHGRKNENEVCSARTPEPEQPDDIPKTPSPFPELNDMVILARKRLVEQDINYKIIKAANTICASFNDAQSLPNRAFLGRLRGLLRIASTAQDILAFINNCTGKPAEKNLERCEVNHKKLGVWLQDVFCCPENFFIKIGYAQGANLPGLSAEKLGSLTAVPLPVPDANDMLWSYQKRYVDLIIQGMVEISKRGDR